MALPLASLKAREDIVWFYPLKNTTTDYLEYGDDKIWIQALTIHKKEIVFVINISKVYTGTRLQKILKEIRYDQANLK